ncbi:hypothetical protein [Gimesia panareensis]|uniref:hypothetical protein n=1 Tax=Gimesia panareensis TaxID=2527978 RepID=UPI00119DEDCC|nr:hypothetical protein [Gimesia panareensis]
MMRSNLYLYTVNLLVVWGSMLLMPSMVFAVDIEETIWGFSNQQVKGKCVPLSLRLSNNTPEVFDETVQLNRMQYGGSKVGAPLYRKVYLPPYSSQWVQFYPYIIDGYQENWSLNWGTGGLEYRNLQRSGNTTAATGPLRVILTSDRGLLQKGARFKRYPEDLFPPFVTATDSLDEVILDHIPRWDLVRRTSFLNWVEQGGVLHLLPDSNGAPLKFTSVLSRLNAPFDHFRIGSGLVIRHNGKLNQLTDQVLNERIEAVRSSEAESLGSDFTDSSPTGAYSGSNESDLYRYGDFNSGILYQLSKLTYPQHNWAIIYIMALIYIFLIFPGCHLFQQRQKTMRYRNSLIFILSSVAVFSIIFWNVGKRGYGEKTTIDSLMVARPLSNNQLDLTCWMNCFVTEGDVYQFSAEGEGIIFTTAQAIEKVRGGIFNGNEGKFVSDIPPFSSRRLLYRVKAPYSDPRFSVIDYQLESVNDEIILSRLRLKTETPLPMGIEKRQLIFGKYVYDLIPSKGQESTELILGKNRELLSSWEKYLDSDLLDASRIRTANSDADKVYIYDSLYNHLILKEFNLLSEHKLQQYQGDRSSLKLFLYGEVPETLKVQSDVQGTQQGHILFVYDLALPVKKNTKHE